VLADEQHVLQLSPDRSTCIRLTMSLANANVSRLGFRQANARDRNKRSLVGQLSNGGPCAFNVSAKISAGFRVDDRVSASSSVWLSAWRRLLGIFANKNLAVENPVSVIVEDALVELVALAIGQRVIDSVWLSTCCDRLPDRARSACNSRLRRRAGRGYRCERDRHPARSDAREFVARAS